MADDLGWSDVGYHSLSGIQTPNIDRLAKNGIILTNHYVQPLCSPSRASLLTGKYPIHVGGGLNEDVFYPDEDAALPIEHKLLPERLKELGYFTALIGKWHLGFSKKEYLPTHRGFDKFFGFYSGAIDYSNYNQTGYRCRREGIVESIFKDLRNQDSIVNISTGKYSQSLFNDEALNLIRNHNKSKPLFLFMSYQTVHDPLQAPSSYIEKYKHIKDPERRVYAAMTTYLDESLNNLTEALMHNGYWSNTILLFLSDNGGNPTTGGYNWPLRGAKGTLWEGGIKSVSFITGGYLKKVGIVSHALSHITDWYPTILNLVNDSTHIESLFDGVDIWKELTQEKQSRASRKYIIHNINNCSYAIRRGDWKLITEIDIGWLKPPEGHTLNLSVSERPLDPREFAGYLLDPKLPRTKDFLFNIAEDKEERFDRSKEFPDMVKELIGLLNVQNKTVIPTNRKYSCDLRAIEQAKKDGFWGPYL